MIDIVIMNNAHVVQFDLNLLLALNALLEEGNVTRAGERIGVTQSAMSHALARLRAALGDPLFVRVPGGMKPTPRAAAMAEPLSRALADLGRALAAPAVFVPANSRRRFVVVTDDYLERLLLPRIMSRIWEHAPGIDVQVVPVDTRLANDLISGRSDVIISVQGVVGKLPGAFTQHLFEERFVCLVRSGHPLARQKLTLERYVAFPHVLVAPAGKPGSIVDTALARVQLRRRVALTVPHFLAAPHIVAESDMVLTVGERLARGLGGAFSVLVPPLKLPTFHVALYWHERNQIDPAHQWFRAQISEAAHRL